MGTMPRMRDVSGLTRFLEQTPFFGGLEPAQLRGVQDSLELVLDVARDRRMWILEVSIAILILVELVLSVWRH